jgi:hypothetical protein
MLEYILTLILVSFLGFVLATKFVPGMQVRRGWFKLSLYYAVLQCALACGCSILFVCLLAGVMALAMAGNMANLALPVVLGYFLLACLWASSASLFFWLQKLNSEPFGTVRPSLVWIFSAIIVGLQIYLIRPIIHDFFSNGF